MMIVESNDNNNIVVKEVNDLSVTFEGKVFDFEIDIYCSIYISILHKIKSYYQSLF